MLLQNLCRIVFFAVLVADTVNAKSDDVTYAGAIKTASTDGLVPQWKKPSLSDVKGNEQPLFSITHANQKEHTDVLSHGSRTMLETIPDYRIDVYPSHRTAIVPDDIEQNMKQRHCQLIDDGNGISPCLPGSPFTQPVSGLQAIWNHLLRFRGKAISNTANRITVFPNDTRSTYKANQDTLYVYGQSRIAGDGLKKVLYMTRSQVIEPVSASLTLNLAKYTINQVENKPAFWKYFPGLKQVKRMPVSSHDFAVNHSDGFLTQDSLDMFNGAPDQYDWKLAERKTMIVPYNVQNLVQSAPSKELILKTHINPDALRYEHHRVWIVEANLKPTAKHIYKKRRFYIDEDSWQILMVDLYNEDNTLIRYQEAYPFIAWDIPALVAPVTAIYDFKGKGYQIDGLNDKGKTWNFMAKFRPGDFTPEALRRKGK